MRRFILLTALLCLQFSTIQASPPQRRNPEDLRKFIESTSELEFQTALNKYVYDLYLDYGMGKIHDEKYLISLMELINREISQRLSNPGEARKTYFADLTNMLKEIQRLKGRLTIAGIRDLDTFISDLERRITRTIREQHVDFKKKKVFQDALQMLYVSEEMIKLDQYQGDTNLAEKISQAKAELLSAFGEISTESGAYSGKRPTIYNLFVEWKKTEQTKYNLRLADVRLARINLLKSASISDVQRMFNDELRVAYAQFNFGDYDLAERLLGDMIDTYPAWGVRSMDDLLFYRAESNFALDRLLQARDGFEQLLSEYPGTAYLPRVYERLVQIDYSLEDYSRAIEYAGLYQNVAATTRTAYYDVQFLLAMSNYQLGNYDQSVALLQNIPQQNSFYPLARYFIGNAYADGQRYDEAMQTFSQLAGSKSTPKFIVGHALYKLALLEYEKGNYSAAIDYLIRISDFERYDKVLNALAWSYFELERNRPKDQVRHYAQAELYARRLVDEYYASPYKMEANSLLAYIKQLEGAPVQAIGLYREVYQEKVQKTPISEYVGERKRLQAVYAEARLLEQKAIEENDKQAYLTAIDLVADLEKQLLHLAHGESRGAGLAIFREVETVIDQIRELNRLKLLAEESGRKDMQVRIDSLQIRLALALENAPPEIFDSTQAVNVFDDYPVGKLVAEEQFRFQRLEENRREAMDEMAQTEQMISSVNEDIARAAARKDFRTVTRLEQKRDELQTLRNDYDRLVVATHQTGTVADPYPEFSRWGDLGAFGIINVYFDQKQNAENQLVQVGHVLDDVNEQLDQRKQVIDSKIKKIEAEVRFMTMKARMEERARLRAERERAFRESYFDTRESEAPEENKP